MKLKLLFLFFCLINFNYAQFSNYETNLTYISNSAQYFQDNSYFNDFTYIYPGDYNPQSVYTVLNSFATSNGNYVLLEGDQISFEAYIVYNKNYPPYQITDYYVFCSTAQYFQNVGYQDITSTISYLFTQQVPIQPNYHSSTEDYPCQAYYCYNSYEIRTNTDYSAYCYNSGSSISAYSFSQYYYDYNSNSYNGNMNATYSFYLTVLNDIPQVWGVGNVFTSHFYPGNTTGSTSSGDYFQIEDGTYATTMSFGDTNSLLISCNSFSVSSTTIDIGSGTYNGHGLEHQYITNYDRLFTCTIPNNLEVFSNLPSNLCFYPVGYDFVTSITANCNSSLLSTCCFQVCATKFVSGQFTSTYLSPATATTIGTLYFYSNNNPTVKINYGTGKSGETNKALTPTLLSNGYYSVNLGVGTFSAGSTYTVNVSLSCNYGSCGTLSDNHTITLTAISSCGNLNLPTTSSEGDSFQISFSPYNYNYPQTTYFYATIGYTLNGVTTTKNYNGFTTQIFSYTFPTFGTASISIKIGAYVNGVQRDDICSISQTTISSFSSKNVSPYSASIIASGSSSSFGQPKLNNGTSPTFTVTFYDPGYGDTFSVTLKQNTGTPQTCTQSNYNYSSRLVTFTCPSFLISAIGSTSFTANISDGSANISYSLTYLVSSTSTTTSNQMQPIF